MTVTEQIMQIYNNAQNMKSVLTSKGQTVGDTLSDYPDVITNLPDTVDNIGNIREISSAGVYQTPSNSFSFSLPSEVANVDIFALRGAFYMCTSLTSVDLSNLKTVSGNNALSYAFYGCTALTSVDLSNLSSVSGSSALSGAFEGCSKLTSVDLSSLTTVNGNYAFQYAFRDCTSLTSVDLSSLTTLSGNRALSHAFGYCTKLTDVYFRALTTSSFLVTSSFSDMLYGTGTTVTHTLHFPSNVESTTATLDGYPTFGGTSGYVTLAYDLPATS